MNNETLVGEQLPYNKNNRELFVGATIEVVQKYHKDPTDYKGQYILITEFGTIVKKKDYVPGLHYRMYDMELKDVLLYGAIIKIIDN